MDMADQPVDILVAVGFGLGHHLAAFRARNPCPVLVYEPRAARLRAALVASPDLLWLEDEDVVLTDDPDKLREEIAARLCAGPERSNLSSSFCASARPRGRARSRGSRGAGQGIDGSGLGHPSDEDA